MAASSVTGRTGISVADLAGYRPVFNAAGQKPEGLETITKT
jgi:hypothetical protein